MGVREDSGRQKTRRRGHWWTRRLDDRGAAMVEFAMVLPILVMLLLGIITFGVAWNTSIQIEHAAREGARYGATVPYDEDYSGNAADNDTWAEVVRNQVIARSAGELELGDDICVALVEGTSTPGNEPAVASLTFGTSYYTTEGDGTACYDDSGGASSLRVQVTAKVDEQLDTGFWSRDITLEGQASAQHDTAQI